MIKFLLFSDFHYNKNKHPITVNDLEKILRRGADEKVDFVIQCGDFCDDAVNSPELFKVFLENKYGLPVYGIYGNHELEIPGNTMEFITPKLSNRKLEKPSCDASYWYTDIKGFRLIGLDSNYSFDPVVNKWEHTLPGRTMGKPGNTHLAYIYPDEMKWLEGVLEDAKEQGLKAILFSHHPLSGCFNFNCGNGFEVRKLLKKFKHTGVMCINGDLHAEFYAGIDDVIYYAITATRYIDANSKGDTAYPDEATFEYLDYDIQGNYIGSYERKLNTLTHKSNYYCEEPLSAVVTITDEGIVEIKGSCSNWLHGIEPVNKVLQFPHENYITDKSFKLDF